MCDPALISSSGFNIVLFTIEHQMEPFSHVHPTGLIDAIQRCPLRASLVETRRTMLLHYVNKLTFKGLKFGEIIEFLVVMITT